MVKKDKDAIYCGIKKVPKGKKVGTMTECMAKDQIRLYGKYKVDKNILTGPKNRKEAVTKDSLRLKQVSNRGKINKLEKLLKETITTQKEKDDIKKQQDALRAEIKQIGVLIDKLYPMVAEDEPVREPVKKVIKPKVNIDKTLNDILMNLESTKKRELKKDKQLKMQVSNLNKSKKDMDNKKLLNEILKRLESSKKIEAVKNKELKSAVKDINQKNEILLKKILKKVEQIEFEDFMDDESDDESYDDFKDIEVKVKAPKKKDHISLKEYVTENIRGITYSEYSSFVNYLNDLKRYYKNKYPTVDMSKEKLPLKLIDKLTSLYLEREKYNKLMKLADNDNDKIKTKFYRDKIYETQSKLIDANY